MPRPTAIEPLVTARAAALTYDGAEEPALSGVDLELGAGELVILLGPNGGGKTTLFRGLIREIAITSGTLTVEARVAYLPQQDLSRTDFPVTALDVALMGTLAERRLWQRPRRADRSRAADALAEVGLGSMCTTAYGELSGGQRRRVLLARTIVQNAPVILLDEPLAGVDPASAEVINDALDSLRDDGRLVLVASHDIERARRADRVLCLNRSLIANGRPGDVLTAEILRETYGADLTMIDTQAGGNRVAVIEHHHHDH
ncbi:MAG: metal ABC transporter ATP-binding protein [Solirubrobacterales bacterium]